MKTLRITTIAIFSLLSTVAFAGKDCADKIRNADLFTPEQIQMKIDQCNELKADKEAFRNSLSAEQKAIMKNKEVSRKERKAQLKTTLSPEQHELKRKIKAKRKAQKIAFKKTLTPAQKKQLRARRKARKG